MRLELHPDARGELRSAAVWYDGHRAGLGDEFVNEVTAALVNAASTPASFPVWPGTSSTAIRIRRAVLSRFPYAIAFEAEMDTLLVLAIAHAKRRPLYWLARKSGPA